MKLVRYTDSQNQTHHGAQHPDGTVTQVRGDIFAAYEDTDVRANVVKLLAPIVPTQILCIGLNYREHAEESNAKLSEFPVLFTKGVNTLQNPFDPIEIPTSLRSNEVDYECELAVVIGRGPNGEPCKNVARHDALKYVAGYTCANDVSARDWQLKNGGGQWCRGKFFDTFCPLGPALVTPDDIPDPNSLRISTSLNGQIVQDSNTADMIFDVPAIISFLSGSCTLVPGTVILTGTPQGVGMASKPPRWLVPGDTVSIEIQRVGTLTNPVISEP